MNIHNFALNDTFKSHSKEYQPKPIRAAQYKPGMENGFMVYFSNSNNKRRRIIHEGVRFFPTVDKAREFINTNKRQYVRGHDKLEAITVEYDPPMPVLYRKDSDAINKDGIHFCFGKNAFVSDQSNDYEFFVLGDRCWIIQDADGRIRVWEPDSGEPFWCERYIVKNNI